MISMKYIGTESQ